MKKKIEKDKMADFEVSVMVKLNTEISKKFDEYIVEGLKRKGFEFETKEELISFISNNCTCEIDNDFLLYPNGCNDNHTITAVKNALKIINL